MKKKSSQGIDLSRHANNEIKYNLVVKVAYTHLFIPALAHYLLQLYNRRTKFFSEGDEKSSSRMYVRATVTGGGSPSLSGDSPVTVGGSPSMYIH